MIDNNDIRSYLGLPLVRNVVMIEQVDALEENSNTLMFINKAGLILRLIDEGCSNCVFLVDESYPEFLSSHHNDFIRVSNPKYKFCLVVEKFELMSKLQLHHQPNPFTDLYYALKDEIKCLQVNIGEGFHCDEGVIIGGEDFSPVQGDTRYDLVQFPQLGGVKIGDNVTIKYHSMVGKGTFGYTTIGDNTMIDYGCQIGHNCKIGKSCIIAAGTIIGGSTTIGNNVTIGIGAKIRNGVTIGNGASIGMGSVVIKNVPDNCVVVGNPARIINHEPIFDQGGLV